MSESTKWDRVDRAYEFLRGVHDRKEVFSLADLATATGWTESTVATYVSKKWATLILEQADGFRCNDRIKTYNQLSFRKHHSQVTATGQTMSGLLVSKAVAACIAAIEVYNKPDFPYRNENFSLLIGSAWELLLKAKILLDANDALDSLYAADKNGEVILSKSGNPRTIALMTAADKLHASGILPRTVLGNLRVMTCIRDEAAHLPGDDVEMNKRLQEIGVAAVRNFATAASAWFGYDFGQFNMFLMPLSFSGAVDTEVVGVRSEQAERIFKFVAAIQDEQSSDEDPDYSVALRLDARFVKTDAADALKVRISKDPDATPIRLTEDDIFSRFPYTHAQLLDILRNRYSDFKQNAEFNQRLARLREEVDDFHIERRLNPKNPRSAYQRFYHSKAVEAFDKFYTRVRRSGA